jgi:hypothetical protein
MGLSSVGNPAWNTIRGVRFAMLYGPTIVPVLVTHDALTDIEPNLPDIGGHLACFNKHRAAIERGREHQLSARKARRRWRGARAGR